MIIYLLIRISGLLNLIEKYFKFGIYPINKKQICVSKW